MKTLKILFLVISIVGFLDAAYLSVKYFQGEPPVCTLLNGCDVVTGSKYAAIWGIPIALLGAFYYLTIFILTVIYLDTKKEKFIKFAARITPLGFLFSLWLVYLQIFTLEALCLYCIISAISSTALLVIGLLILYRLKQNFRDNF